MTQRPDPFAGVFVVLVAAWVVVIGLVLTHGIFVTNDSVSNYAHVWFVSKRFWGGHGIPYHMPVLAHGEALAFPYAFLPWFSAALLRPLLGDWVVTLWFGVGFVGLLAGMRAAFPELRFRGYWTMLLLNPFLIEALILGQLPFIWGTALLFFAIACCRRQRVVAATLLLGAAQATHPAVLLPIGGVLFLIAFVAEKERRVSLTVAYGVSLLIALPAVWMTIASPALGEAGPASALANLLGTVALRSVVIFLPLLLLALAGKGWRPGLVILPALLAVNLIALPLRQDAFGWEALVRRPDESLQAYTRSSHFERGAVYRILRVKDGKMGMYDIVRAGGVLDSELFPESIDRRSWTAAPEYIAFLEKRRVDYVIVYGAYDRRYKTNEHSLLHVLSESGTGSVADPTVVTLVERTADYDVFHVSVGRLAATDP